MATPRSLIVSQKWLVESVNFDSSGNSSNLERQLGEIGSVITSTFQIPLLSGSLAASCAIARVSSAVSWSLLVARARLDS